MALSPEKINQIIDNVKQRGTYYLNNPDFLALTDELRDYLLGNTSQIPDLTLNYWGWYFSGITDLLDEPAKWTSDDERIFDLIFEKNNWNNVFNNYFFYAVEKWISAEKDEKTVFDIVAECLKRRGFSEPEILQILVDRLGYKLIANYNPKTLSSAGKYFISHLPSNLTNLIQFSLSNYHHSYFFNTILFFANEKFDEYIDDLLMPVQNYYGYTEFDEGKIYSVIEKDVKKYEPALLNLLSKLESPANRDYIRTQLAEKMPEKYGQEILKNAYTYLEEHTAFMQNKKITYYYEKSSYDESHKRWRTLSEIKIDYILKNDQQNAVGFVSNYLKENGKIEIGILEVIDQHLKVDSVDTLAQAFDNTHIGNESFFKKLLEILSKYDYSKHEDKVWNLTKNKSKRIRELAAVTLAKLGEKAIPQAAELLNAKNAVTRQCGALLLTLINTDKAKLLLQNALDNEKNDDARDVMLQALAETLYINITEKEVDAMVASAEKRGKLEKSVEKWLDEKILPELRYKSGKKLDEKTLRFLLYRMSRTKEIRPDAEAKPVLALIDREQSGIFAKKLFKTFLDNGADSKQKYCLTLAGLLGDDEVVDSLRATVNNWAEASRGKMAEYAVGALALIGSNKALRAVEFLSRKYKNKNKNIGEAALKALQVAAEELGISMYELSDSIIPDFDFDGLFKYFTVGNDEFRAFIGNDFKLQFFNEDNKLLKSPPKGISAELKEEFKEIGKEVRDIVRSQSNRLEQYLVIQRRWTTEAWQAFFLNNPIMFVYALKLVWGVFDKQGNLEQAFYCTEDTSLMSLEDEEISLDEDKFIGMVHPASVSPEEAQAWIRKFYDLEIEAIFPQMNRAIERLPEEQKEIKFYDGLSKKKINSYGAVGLFEKRGWQRGSVVDGGWVSTYHKVFQEAGIEAFVETEGIVVGYYDYDDTYLGRLFFVKAGSVRTGSYVYDEPSNDKDVRLFTFGEIPELIYSEVISDLKQMPFIEEEKKEGERQQ
jgi:hypothetical protein